MSSDGKPALSLNICVNFRAGDILPSCGARGGRELADALEAGITERGIEVEFNRLHCMGKCHIGPTMKFAPGGPFIMGAQASDAPLILDHIEAGDIDALAEAFSRPEDELNLEK